MTEVNIIVPHDKVAVRVWIDKREATKMVTHTPPGWGYDIETWQAPADGIGLLVAIEYDPK